MSDRWLKIRAKLHLKITQDFELDTTHDTNRVNTREASKNNVPPASILSESSEVLSCFQKVL